MRQIGLFGGSFNPIHVGHIELARQLRRLAALDEVWLMVSPQNPMKRASGLLDDQLRLDMARRALEDVEGVEACDYEMRLPRPSYTWNTLQALSQDYPDCQFTMLIGGDNWLIFPRWYRAVDILNQYRIVVYPRRDSDIDRSALPDNVQVVDTEFIDVSSTMIRQRVADGLPVTGLVPASIEPMVNAYYAPKR